VPPLEHLEQRAKESLELDPSYEMKALPPYLGDGSAIRKCVPPGAAVTAPFVLYVSVTATGTIDYQVANPPTPVAQCMIGEASARVLPVPARPLVVKIEMRFTQ